MKDYYKILGISKDANISDIKKKYRELAHKYHPDKGSGDEAKFKEVNEAYEILSDSSKRREYDLMGGEEYSGGKTRYDRQNEGQASGNWDFNININDFSDLFNNDFFGGQQYRSRRGGDFDIYLNVLIDFLDAINGCKKRIQYQRTMDCSECGGSGRDYGAKIVQCPECNGTGIIKKNIPGFGSSSMVCSRCDGSGEIIDKPCKICGGSGSILGSHQINIDIPAGVDNGTRLKFPSGGNVKDGLSGDLYIDLSIGSHPYFSRDGNNIYINITINFIQAILGAQIIVPSIDGKVKVKIPQGTQNMDKIKLSNKGVPYNSGRSRGDQIINIKVSTPRSVNETTKYYLQKIKGKV